MNLNTIRRGNGEIAFQWFNILFMSVMILITLYPFIYVIMSSLSDSRLLMTHTGFLLWPEGFTWKAYKLVFQNPNILRGYGNTLFVVTVGTSINLFLTCLGAYVLSRKGVPGTKTLMMLIVFTMFFSGGMIPSYLLVNNWMHLGNSLFALIIPGAISTWNLIILRTSFAAIPESLFESAKMDGANDLTILVRLVLPLSLPVLAVMTLFYGVQHWNAWFSSMLYLRDRDMFPLQLILREILIQNSTEYMTSQSSAGEIETVGESIKYATIMVATLPILFIYPFLQRYFVRGVMIGSIKG
ncbi:sugar ABC transporter permease [Paenibacillus sp. Soil766]|nr:sugar ABC transporter permease [Paenibacillus sp. Soil766]